MSWQLVYTRQARKDAKKLAASGLKAKAQALLEILETDPFQTPPAYEKLVGDLEGAYSRRINVQHRLVYEVLDAEKAVKLIAGWGATQRSRAVAWGRAASCVPASGVLLTTACSLIFTLARGPRPESCHAP